MLTGLRIELRTLQDLHGRSDPEFDSHFESARNLTEQSLRSLRDLAMGLRPAMLDDLGLGSAIQWQARKFSKVTSIPVNVSTSGLPPSLPEAVRTAVYRVVQEALTNAARHARATSIEVSVEVRDGELVVVIRDNGAGFDTKAADRRGLGLLGMQERVNDLGGGLQIHSETGHGTTIRALIPVVEEVAEDGHPCSFGR
jgi:signal transduction histidine kinase